MTLQVIGTKVRMLVGAVVVAAALAAVAAAPASADNKKNEHPKDDGTRCAVQTGPGSFDFYLPGESISVPQADSGNGPVEHEYTCDDEGTWVEQTRTQPTTSGPRHLYTRPVTLLPGRRFNRINGVIAPVPSSATTTTSGGSKPVTGRRGR
jgi:hypothetical protein